MSKFGAVIAAARLELRHNIMKPQLALNGSTVIKTTVDTLRAAGCSPMVVVSGRNSADLIRHLGRKNIAHVVNADYKNTDMLQSAQLGLQTISAVSRVEYVFFLPADVPVMEKASVLNMVNYMKEHPECDVLLPMHNGSCGHPILLRRNVIDYILTYRGEGGLRAALAEFGGVCSRIEVDDEGMVIDVDKDGGDQSYDAYAKRQVKQVPMFCTTDIILGRDKPFFNRQLAGLLRQIDETQSLSAACRNMDISYSNGWKSIKSAEIQLGFDLLESARGGQRGGTSCLTKQAKALLQTYEKLQDTIFSICNEGMRELLLPQVTCS